MITMSQPQVIYRYLNTVSTCTLLKYFDYYIFLSSSKQLKGILKSQSKWPGEEVWSVFFSNSGCLCTQTGSAVKACSHFTYANQLQPCQNKQNKLGTTIVNFNLKMQLSHLFFLLNSHIPVEITGFICGEGCCTNSRIFLGNCSTQSLRVHFN